MAEIVNCHTNIWNIYVNYEFCRMLTDQDQQIININQSETISGYSSAMKSLFSVHSGGVIDSYIKLSAFLDE